MDMVFSICLNRGFNELRSDLSGVKYSEVPYCRMYWESELPPTVRTPSHSVSKLPDLLFNTYCAGAVQNERVNGITNR